MNRFLNKIFKNLSNNVKKRLYVNKYLVFNCL